MIDIQVWAETGRGELLKIDFCCLAYILTSNLLFTSLAAGRWEVGGTKLIKQERLQVYKDVEIAGRDEGILDL